MPERPLKIAGYAAGASLAAITLVYVFGPTYFLDDDAAHSSKSSRKKGVVGLVNPANDCFINSVLQALAGLPELRVYLIREIHRRRLNGEEMYSDLTAALEARGKQTNSNPTPEWKILGLQQGLVTAGLKDVLDALNERPIYKKTISAQSFIRVVEAAFRTRLSRSQQDAQEFLQLVAERLDDEHHAARKVRRRARKLQDGGGVERVEEGGMERIDEPKKEEESEEDDEDDEPPFPFEGKLESQVECSHCHFKPKPAVSSFVSLTLHVPQESTSTTLNACFDQMLKIEKIEDFICDRCRLEHAIQLNARQLTKTSLSPEERQQREQDQTKLEKALHEDPEKPPKDVKLPESSTAPKRQISRHMRVSSFPKILAIHLSRSVWDLHASSSKNMARVAFPETLPLGGLLDRKTYRLLGVVTHKGGHNSGHYESFRRQSLNPPFSTPVSLGTEGVYSYRSTPAGSPRISAAPSPHLGAVPGGAASTSTCTQPSSPALSSRSLDTNSTHTAPSRNSSTTTKNRTHSQQAPTSAPAQQPQPADVLPTPGLPKDKEPAPKRLGSVTRPLSVLGRAKKSSQERWWRISDEKVKESKTSEVLGMQREVYLLFYEMIPDSA